MIQLNFLKPISAVLLLISFFIFNDSIAYSKDFTAQQKKEAADNSLKEALDLGYPNKSYIQSMLLDEEYSELESYFKDLEEKYKTNPTYESLLLKSYKALDSESRDLLPYLNKWVKKGENYIALSARGCYLSKRGFDIRGTKYIKDTPKINLIQMHDFHKKAKIDLERSIEINHNFMPAYEQLIQIAKAAGDDNYKRRLISKALRQDKRTYYVRHAYLESLEPKWGGSYVKMQTFINESIKYGYLNPRIWSFQGHIDYNKAFHLKLEKKYDLAIEYFCKALSYGDRTEWLRERAYCYFKTKQYKKELADLERYLYYKPNEIEIKNYINKLKQYLSKNN